MKIPKLLLLATLFALSGPFAHADAGPIGSELPFIEGPPDLVQSLRDSFAAGRPKKQKKQKKQIADGTEKAAKKAKQRLAQVRKTAKEAEKD